MNTEQKNITSYLDLLTCPFCKNDLVFEEKKLICNQCKKAFLIKEGIPIFIKEKAISFRGQTLKF